MSDTPTTDRFVSGFVSILGRPNAGKSTLLNALVGTKISIVADKPQTTRTLVQGVLTLPSAQIVFIDTPGIHRGDTLFNRRMMETVRSALDGRDLLIYVADALDAAGAAEREAVAEIASTRTTVFLALNKIDRIKDKSQILPLIEQYKAMFEFAEYLPISARNGVGLDELRTAPPVL